MNITYFALVFALVANAVANILIKEGMKAKSLGLSDPKALMVGIAFDPVVLTGVFFFGLALAAYSFVLSKLPLSIAYPIMTSAGFLIVVSYSAFKLREALTVTQVAGIVLIAVGIVLVASNLRA